MHFSLWQKHVLIHYLSHLPKPGYLCLLKLEALTYIVARHYKLIEMHNTFTFP